MSAIPPLTRERFRVAGTVVDPARNSLTRDTSEQTVEPRVMDVLCALAEHPGEVRLRHEILDRVWGASAGTDEALSRAVSILRKAFRDLGVEGDVIETAPRRGYRLVPEVETLPPTVALCESPAPDTAKTRRGRLLVITAAVVAAVSVVTLIQQGAEEPPATVATLSDTPSIAVLPFQPFSADPDLRSFGDGLTDELLNTLAGIEDLDVTARTSSLKYREPAGLTVQEIGAALGVDYVVEGSVREGEDALRTTVQLIRVTDGFHVWSDTFDTEGGDPLRRQDELVRRMGRALELRLGVGRGALAGPARPANPEATERYYQGLTAWHDRMRVDGAAQAAYDHLRAAVALDPDLAEAWNLLTVIGTTWGSGPLARDKATFMAQVEADMARALELSPDDHGVHAARALWFSGTRIDVDRAREHVERAEALAPTATVTLFARASHDWMVGDVDGALAALRTAMQLNPDNALLPVGYAYRNIIAGDADLGLGILDDCHRRDCLQEGFVPLSTHAVAISGDRRAMARWWPVFTAWEARLADVPAARKPHVTKVNLASMAIAYGRADDHTAEIAAARELLMREDITDHIAMWGPTLATVLPPERTVELLEIAHESGDLFATQFAFAPLYGRTPYPAAVRDHPRLRAFWQSPDLARLLEVRRENGWDADF